MKLESLEGRREGREEKTEVGERRERVVLARFTKETWLSLNSLQRVLPLDHSALTKNGSQPKASLPSWSLWVSMDPCLMSGSTSSCSLASYYLSCDSQLASGNTTWWSDTMTVLQCWYSSLLDHIKNFAVQHQYLGFSLSLSWCSEAPWKGAYLCRTQWLHISSKDFGGPWLTVMTYFVWISLLLLALLKTPAFLELSQSCCGESH